MIIEDHSSLEKLIHEFQSAVDGREMGPIGRCCDSILSNGVPKVSGMIAVMDGSQYCSIFKDGKTVLETKLSW